uniref:Secreted protein n=1 Tax=Macrostomum lignano TaxID=282301 RepID=A0A1I8IPZ2_9PLAT
MRVEGSRRAPAALYMIETIVLLTGWTGQSPRLPCCASSPAPSCTCSASYSSWRLSSAAAATAAAPSKHSMLFRMKDAGNGESALTNGNPSTTCSSRRMSSTNIAWRRRRRRWSTLRATAGPAEVLTGDRAVCRLRQPGLPLFRLASTMPELLAQTARS